LHKKKRVLLKRNRLRTGRGEGLLSLQRKALDLSRKHINGHKQIITVKSLLEKGENGCKSAGLRPSLPLGSVSIKGRLIRRGRVQPDVNRISQCKSLRTELASSRCPPQGEGLRCPRYRDVDQGARLYTSKRPTQAFRIFLE